MVNVSRPLPPLLQLEYGGAALFNAGKVTFHQQAYFRDNGQIAIEGRYSTNADGGAILNIGDIQVTRVTVSMSCTLKRSRNGKNRALFSFNNRLTSKDSV